MSLQPGKHVTDTLRLVRLLGRGAMGSVWVADHLALQSQVAVKFMSQTHLDDPVAVQRFRQEARAAAEIKSPHVAQVFDHGVTSDGQPFIVMEVLEGESLDKRVKRIGPLSPWELASILSQSCKALAKAHERGILHRDIKPPNIFLIEAGGEPFVKILDFGVAKFSGEEAMEMTAAGHMVGTPAYMSPEQLFHGRDMDHRGDLWSLSVVAYWSLTGERPFEGATLGELCAAIKRGEFDGPSTMRNDLPPDVDAFFARAFHGDIDARFANAKELAQAFEAAVGVSSTMHSTPSGVAALMTYGGTALSSPPAPSRRRWPLWAAAAAVGGFGVVAVALIAGGQDAAPAAQPPAREEPTAESKPTIAPKPIEAPVEATPTAEESAKPPAPKDGAPKDGAPKDRAPNARAPKARTKPPEPPPKDAPDERDEKAAKTLGI